MYIHSFVIETYQKPYEAVIQKNLADTPAPLQCMICALSDMTVSKYIHLVKKYCLLMCFPTSILSPGPEMTLDIVACHSHILTDAKDKFQQVFGTDAQIHALVDFIMAGWLDDISFLTHCALTAS